MITAYQHNQHGNKGNTMRFEQTEELQIKSELEPFVVRLEKFASKIEDKDKDTKAEMLLEKLVNENTIDLIKSVLTTYINTGNAEYFELFRRICSSIEVDGREQYFTKYTDEIPYLYLFNTGAEHFTPLVKELVEEVEFNGKKYTLEEYSRLSQEITLINLDLLAFATNKKQFEHWAKLKNMTTTQFFEQHQMLNISLISLREDE